jgi:hypothetical protein
MSSDPGTEGHSPAPSLRVIAGTKPAAEVSGRRKFVDKNARPAHRQLRMITVPTWLPWVAKLLEPITVPPSRAFEAADGTTFTWRKGGVAGVICLACGFALGAVLWHALHGPLAPDRTPASEGNRPRAP